MATASSRAGQVGHSRAEQGWIPAPIMWHHFQFHNAFVCIHTCGTHAHPCNFFLSLFPEKKRGPQWHISNMAAPSQTASATYQRDVGKGR